MLGAVVEEEEEEEVAPEAEAGVDAALVAIQPIN